MASNHQGTLGSLWPHQAFALLLIPGLHAAKWIPVSIKCWEGGSEDVPTSVAQPCSQLNTMNVAFTDLKGQVSQCYSWSPPQKPLS